MSDERLRELERRWKETAAVEDEALWLTERVRAGELSPDGLEAAACLGHDAARRAVGETPAGVDPLVYWWLGEDQVETGAEPRWSRALSKLGPTSPLRAGIAIAIEHAEELVGAERAAATVLIELAEREVIEGESTLGEAQNIVHSAGSPSVQQIAGFLWPEFVALPESLELERQPWRRYWGITREGDLVGIALLHDVAPWALSYRDPVRERAEARLREAPGE